MGGLFFELFQQKWRPLLRPENAARKTTFSAKVATTFAPGKCGGKNYFFSKSGDQFCARKMRQEKLLFQQKWAPLLLAEQASLDNAQEKSFFLQSWCRLNATRCREKQSVFPLMGIVLRLIFSVWQLESPWKPWHLKKPCYLKT
ncbi:MAG: hypothetical protein ACTSUY_05040 [Alphaproteobacteria bacterium]